LEIQEGVYVLVRPYYNVAAIPARATVHDRVTGITFLMQTRATVAAVACLDLDLRGIYKHIGFRLLILLWQDADCLGFESDYPVF